MDSQIYCVEKSIAFLAKTEPSSTDWINWYDNDWLLGGSSSGVIKYYPLHDVGVHDIEAEWTAKGVSSHVGIYVGNPFTFEYDHQIRFDVFQQGIGVVENAFKYGHTYLDIRYDDDTLVDCCVPYDEIFDYFLTHVQSDGQGNTVYPGYLCGIEAFLEPGTEYVIDTLLGIGSYKAWSFVCVELAVSNSSLNAVTIHELGHQRAHLSHLCREDGTMNPAHNDEACVMSNSAPIADCTGKNVATNPHFCPACCDSLKNETW